MIAGLFKKCNFVGQIPSSIVERNMEDVEGEPFSTEELSQLVSVDCQLDESIRNVNKTDHMKSSNTRTVLLTGVT